MEKADGALADPSDMDIDIDEILREPCNMDVDIAEIEKEMTDISASNCDNENKPEETDKIEESRKPEEVISSDKPEETSNVEEAREVDEDSSLIDVNKPEETSKIEESLKLDVDEPEETTKNENILPKNVDKPEETSKIEETLKPNEDISLNKPKEMSDVERSLKPDENITLKHVDEPEKMSNIKGKEESIKETDDIEESQKANETISAKEISIFNDPEKIEESSKLDEANKLNDFEESLMDVDDSAIKNNDFDDLLKSDDDGDDIAKKQKELQYIEELLKSDDEEVPEQKDSTEKSSKPDDNVSADKMEIAETTNKTDESSSDKEKPEQKRYSTEETEKTEESSSDQNIDKVIKTEKSTLDDEKSVIKSEKTEEPHKSDEDEIENIDTLGLLTETADQVGHVSDEEAHDDDDEEDEYDDEDNPSPERGEEGVDDENDTDYVPDAGEESSQSADDQMGSCDETSRDNMNVDAQMGGDTDGEFEIQYSEANESMFNESNDNCMSISNITSLSQKPEEDDASSEKEKPASDNNIPEIMISGVETLKPESTDLEDGPSIIEKPSMPDTETVSKADEIIPSEVTTSSEDKNVEPEESLNVDVEMKDAEDSSSENKVEDKVVSISEDVQMEDKEIIFVKEEKLIKEEPSEDTNKVFKDVMEGVHKLLQSKFFASEQEKKKLEEFEKTFLQLQTNIDHKDTSSTSMTDDEILKEADSCLQNKGIDELMKASIPDLDNTSKKPESDKTLTEKSNIPDIEILTLDSDDDQPEPVKPQSTETTPVKDTKVAKEKPPPSRKAKCVNPWCESEITVPILACPNFMLSFYKFKYKKSIVISRPTICTVCFEKAIEHATLISSKLRASRSIFNPGLVAIENQVEILDSDSDDETDNQNSNYRINRFKESPLKEMEKSFLMDNLLNTVEETWTKFDLNDVIVKYTSDLEKHILSTKDTAEEFRKDVQALQKETDDIRKSFYDLFKTPVTETIPLIIMSETENQSPKARPKTPNKSEFQLQAVYDEQINARKSWKLMVPPDGPIEIIPLKVGDTVYAMKMSVFGAWAKATVLEVWPRGTPLANGQSSLFSMINVKFETADQESSDAIKQVTGRQVAYSIPSGFRYPVGSRVIALFKSMDPKGSKKQSYYAGVIAETACMMNNYRYLIFFDDGYSQYVTHSDTLRHYEWSPNVWEDIHPDSRDFIRKYLMSYPDRPMVKLDINQRLKVSYNGKWCHAKVLDVDASLALVTIIEMTSQIQIQKQWIYRGSTRLYPLYQELNAVDKRTHTRQRQAANNKVGLPYVQYTRTAEEPIQQPAEPSQTPKMTRAVAKKSTSARNEPVTPNIPVQNVTPQKTTIEMTESNSKSRVVYYSPKTALRPRQMVPHNCNADCNDPRALPLSKLKTYNPLCRPLLNGWERLIVKFKSKRAIIYRTPCGRCVRNTKELHHYLRLVRSDMSVDLFDFDPWVHCLAEFVHAKCLVTKRDLSHGVEAVPIPCVNSYDNSLPEFCSYSTRRIPTEGVNLNLDEEFLCGCDCTDDCQDRTKCQCWQLTLEGAKLLRMDPETVGYQYKRLLDNVSTGIYECNSRCKCALTCLNRVVQHPLQHKLQVFKTLNRGWGIRTMNDLPKGAFICVYAGNLLTDAVANVDGVNEGDEYLAELDYIEVVEKIKESYEADIPEKDKILDEDEDDIKEEPDDADEDEAEPDQDFTPSEYYSPTDGTEKEITTRLRTKKRKIEKTGESITISDDEEADRQPSSFAAPEGINDDDDYVPKYKSVRSFFGEDEACYIMDAKVQGNIGRYLNHSCCPNVFVQNVLVDTHDPRFPWVAFFTLNHIRAGTELTWNYNYEVGSVSGKVLYCRCGAPNCRGRLL